MFNKEIIYNFIKNHRTDNNPIEINDNSETKYVVINGNEYFAWWDKENPKYLNLNNFLIYYGSLIEERDSGKFSAKEIVKYFYLNDKEYINNYKKLKKELKEKYNTDIKELDGNCDFDKLYTLSIPIEEIKNCEKICDVFLKYEQQYSETIKLINN